MMVCLGLLFLDCCFGDWGPLDLYKPGWLYLKRLRTMSPFGCPWVLGLAFALALELAFSLGTSLDEACMPPLLSPALSFELGIPVPMQCGLLFDPCRQCTYVPP